LLDGQAVGEPTMQFPPRLMTRFNAKSLECGRRWKDNPALPALLDDQPG
jgi:hypothetical protein